MINGTLPCICFSIAQRRALQKLRALQSLPSTRFSFQTSSRYMQRGPSTRLIFRRVCGLRCSANRSSGHSLSPNDFLNFQRRIHRTSTYLYPRFFCWFRTIFPVCVCYWLWFDRLRLKLLIKNQRPPRASVETNHVCKWLQYLWSRWWFRGALCRDDRSPPASGCGDTSYEIISARRDGCWTAGTELARSSMPNLRLTVADLQGSSEQPPA
jgi:hypothetical protein